MLVTFSAAPLVRSGLVARREGLSHARKHTATALRSRARTSSIVCRVRASARTGARRILAWERIFTGYACSLIVWTVHVVQRSLTWLARAVASTLAFLGRDTLPTVRACVVFDKPGLDTIMMKPMMARQLSHLGSQFGLVHADRAISFAAIAKVLLSDFASGQRFDCFFRCGRGSIPSLMLLH